MENILVNKKGKEITILIRFNSIRQHHYIINDVFFSLQERRQCFEEHFSDSFDIFLVAPKDCSSIYLIYFLFFHSFFNVFDWSISAFLKLWVATQMWVANTMRMGRESLYLQLLLAKRTISLDNSIATNRITALLHCVSNF